MLHTIVATLIALGCVIWIFRVIGSVTNERPTPTERFERIVMITLLISLTLLGTVTIKSLLTSNQLAREHIKIKMMYSDNIMMDDSTNNWLMWMPEYAEDDQFMQSTEALLSLRLSVYNRQVWAKQKAQQKRFFGRSIYLESLPIIMIKDPTSIAWIQE